jgi:hypothetical protein
VQYNEFIGALQSSIATSQPPDEEVAEEGILVGLGMPRTAVLLVHPPSAS